MFANQQRNSSSKAATFLSLISEHRTIFQSYCQRILAHNPNDVTGSPILLHVVEKLAYNVRDLTEEVMMDEEEENGEGR